MKKNKARWRDLIEDVLKALYPQLTSFNIRTDNLELTYVELYEVTKPTPYVLIPKTTEDGGIVMQDVGVPEGDYIVAVSSALKSIYGCDGDFNFRVLVWVSPLEGENRIRRVDNKPNLDYWIRYHVANGCIHHLTSSWQRHEDKEA